MNDFIPTKTLAKLYEKQDSLWEAYIIYKKIYLQNKDAEIKDKIIELGEKLIDETSYSQITLQIFDKKRLAELSILSKEQYKTYQRVLKDMNRNEQYEDILTAYQENKEVDEDIKNYSGEEIYEIIQTNFGNKKPEDIKLAEIYELIKSK